MRLLLVEDDLNQVEILKPALSTAGYVVELAHDGRDASFLIREDSFDAIVLDLGLPQKPGLEVLSEMRKAGDETPVLVLTGRDTWQERVDGLKAGADDYLGKPFHVEELLARLDAVIRRQYGRSTQKIKHGDLELDPDRQLVIDRDGKEHQLTGIEFRLLRYLMMNGERVLSKSQLSEHVYEEEQIRDSNVIEVYINRLRQRFGKGLIETHRGQGYRLKG